MDKDTAKAILIANLKGSRRKRSPLLTIAAAVRLLLRDGEYKSSRELAAAFDVKRQMIESFDKMNDQPKEIQKLIAESKILIDSSTKLSSIPDKSKRVEIAKVVAGLTAFETRDIIDYWKKHPELSPEECKKVVFDSKTKVKEVHIVVVPFDDKEFREFQEISRTKGLKLDQAAKQAIEKWILNEYQGEKQ